METLVASRTEAETFALAARLARVELPRRPRLAPWVTPVELGDGRLQLRGAELAATLRHPLLVDVYRAVEPLLDGRHTVDEIAEGGPPDVAGTTVLFLLKLLQSSGVLQPAGEAPPAAPEWEAQVAFLSHFVADAAAAHAALATARVGVHGDGPLAAAVTEALGSLGAAAGADDGDLLVACHEGADTAAFEQVNAARLESGDRWLRVALVGTTGYLGPTFVPRQTACFTCLELR